MMLTVVVVVVVLAVIAGAYLYGIWLGLRESRVKLNDAYRRGIDDAAAMLTRNDWS
ncbi:hypothetical protein [Nocardioides sp.]|uniref:hypothetical protein n=1 Tax=Nocardioides sp. TaxID=35761 RepID=UPI0039E39F1A